MTQPEIQSLVNQQRRFFQTGATLPITVRLEALRKLQNTIRQREHEILEALHADLGKSHAEGYMCEVGTCLSEISHMLRHLPRYAKEKTVATPLAQFAARSYIKPVPYGVALVMSPWNYPVLLAIDPLVDAIAAGNTVILKPSAYSPNTSAVLHSLLADCFPPEWVSVVSGGREENRYLLQEKFDYIFFTGSQAVGKEVMHAAAEHLTPITLELGGKSPCIVDASAKIALAAKRIVFGKFLNCGQTCVAPDYILCHHSIREPLLAAIRAEILRQYGATPLGDPEYGKIVNKKHFQRICGLIDPSKVVYGGESCAETLQIAPTILDNVTFEDAVMQEEIFGPLMPILTYSSTEEAIEIVNRGQKPLALYLFTENRSVAEAFTARCAFGGGCINDTIIHLATSNMGFGGVGESGMGSYHGKTGFDTFSHKKSIVDKKTFLDLPMRYHPIRPTMDKWIRRFLK